MDRLDVLAGLVLEDGRLWGDVACDFQLEDARRIGEPRQLIDTALTEAWGSIWAFEWDRVDEILASIDPETRSPGVGSTYEDVVFTKMQLAGEPEEAERRYEEWWESLGARSGDAVGADAEA